jgi:surfactin synthase thioesterase subunit
MARGSSPDLGRPFSGDWELCLVDAPGRGRLSDRPALVGADELTDFLERELAPWPDRPYAFFGHSTGALAAYELAARHHLSDAELCDWLRAVGATPPAVLDGEMLWKVFAPTFRNDFALVGTWRPDPDAGPLPVALSSFGGSTDLLVDRPRLAAWERHTRDHRGLHVHHGGHFYLADHRQLVSRRIVAAVTAVRRAAVASIA